jgi:dUTPase
VVLPKGTRIAQMRIVKIPQTQMVKVDRINMSNDRGGGFGHTGAK